MKQFVVLYYAPKSAMEMMANVTPEEAEAGMKPWLEWMASTGDALVDGGAPLIAGRRLTSGGSADAGTEVSGYSLLQAEDLAAAEKLLDGHPHLNWVEGCAIEVYEAMPLQM